MKSEKKLKQGRPARISVADEERIRAFLDAGMNNSEIARALRVSESTLRPYTKRILAEMAEGGDQLGETGS